MFKSAFFILLISLLLLVPALAEDTIIIDDGDWSLIDVVDEVFITDEGEEIAMPASTPEPNYTDPIARADFIERIIAMGKKLYIAADGKSQRAHYASDIYVCKNFTTYLFRKNRDDFCMAEYPNVQLVIPNNLSAKDSKPYSYGIAWEPIAAEKGNPFYEAASFYYNKELSYDENFELACQFMRQAQRGDFFQMSADYDYGVGAHSAIMLGYDPATDEIHWMDSNMRGGKRDGIRYGKVQFDEVKSVEWWAEAFCIKTRGATLYRLRDDIIYREDAE